MSTIGIHVNRGTSTRAEEPDAHPIGTDREAGKNLTLGECDAILAQVDEILNQGGMRSILVKERLMARLSPEANQVLDAAALKIKEMELETNPLKEPFNKQVYEVIAAHCDKQAALLEIYNDTPGVIATLKRLFRLGRPSQTISEEKIKSYFHVSQRHELYSAIKSLDTYGLINSKEGIIDFHYSITQLGRDLYRAISSTLSDPVE